MRRCIPRAATATIDAELPLEQAPSPACSTTESSAYRRLAPTGSDRELLGGVIADGGEWFVIGNHFIPIPPRSPLVSIIARAVAPYLGRAVENPKLGDDVRHLLQGPEPGKAYGC